MGRTGHYVPTRHPGIRRYIGADGTPGPYAVEVSHRGQRASGRADTLAKAQDLRHELQGKLKAGGYDPSAGRRSVGDAIDLYLRSDLFRRLSAKEQRYRETVTLPWWRARIGGMPLARLSAPVLADLRDALHAEVSAKTVNIYLSHLSQVVRVAMERGWIAGNPVRGIIRPRATSELGEILTDDEVLRLLRAAERSEDSRLRYLIPCLLSCGARIGEYMTTRISDVDTVRGVSLIRRGKSGHPRTVYYHDLGLDALRGAMEVPSITGYLWASRRRGGIHPPYKAMYAALAEAEIEKPGAFGLTRRTSGTWKAVLGSGDSEIREHLGHAPGSPATARYALLGKVAQTSLAERFVARRRMVA